MDGQEILPRYEQILIMDNGESLQEVAKVESLLSLTAPEDPTQQAFHIVAPTLPGFVFSSSPKVSYW